MAEKKKITKEMWVKLARSIDLPEEKIEEAWQKVLDYRKEQAEKSNSECKSIVIKSLDSVENKLPSRQ